MPSLELDSMKHTKIKIVYVSRNFMSHWGGKFVGNF